MARTVVAALLVMVVGATGVLPKEILGGNAAAALARTPRVLASVAVDSPAALAVGAGSVWVSAGAAVVRIDPVTDRIIARIPVPGWPSGIAVADGVVWVARNPDVRSAEVAPPGWLWSINTATNRVFGRPVQLQLPTELAARSGALWVTNGDHGSYGRVFRVDPQLRLIVASIKVPGDPEGIVEQGGSLWVTASDSGELVRINPGTNAVVGHALQTGGALLSIAATAGRLWVGDDYSGAVLQLDPARADPVVTRTPLPSVTGIAADRTAVWATTARPSQLVELDPRTGTTTGRPLPLSAGASSLALGFGSIWVATARAVMRVQR
jgi:streptogramin lyase